MFTAVMAQLPVHLFKMIMGVHVVKQKNRKANLSGSLALGIVSQGQALRVLNKISTLRVVFDPKTLFTIPPHIQRELSLFFFSLFSFLF